MILSQTRNIIESKYASDINYWNRYIHTDGYNIILTDDPRCDELSLADCNLLDEIFDAYDKYPSYIINKIHFELPEYKGYTLGTPVSLRELYNHIGKSESIFEDYLQTKKEIWLFKRY